MTKILLCTISFCLLSIPTHAEFSPQSRCKAGEKIGFMGARAIYGEAALKKNIKLAEKTFAEAEKDKPVQTEKYCALDILGNPVS